MEIGKILKDSYEIVGEIGSGGGGVVYKARHLRLNIDLVVKKVKDGVGLDAYSNKESNILKGLKNTYIPSLYDFIETEDGVYTVMDYVDGEDFESAVRKHGKYDQKQVLKWAEQLGEALTYLHNQENAIIHSDIKPGNIMLTKDGNVCLIDFNISLAMGEEKESAIGISAGFSPPEQYSSVSLYEKILGRDSTWQNNRNKNMPENVQNRGIVADSNDQLTEVLDESLTEPLEDSVTELLDENVTELLEDNVTEVLEENTTEVIDEGKTELLSQTEIQSQENKSAVEATEILSDQKTALLNKDIETASESLYLSNIGKGVTKRSDIYSLGMTLIYMLTGEMPSKDFANHIIVENLDANISEGFALILQKMIDLNPDQRYEDGAEYLKAIRNCYKLDHRYVLLHKKQNRIQFIALSCFILGTAIIFAGIQKIKAEHNAEYYEVISMIDEKMNQYDYSNAFPYVEEAKKFDASRIDAYEKELHLLYLCEDYDQCIEVGMEYVNTIPFKTNSNFAKEKLGNIYYILGNSYFEKEEYENSLNFLETALDLNKTNGLYYRDYAITLAKLGKIEDAEKQLEKGEKLGIAQDSVNMAKGEIHHIKNENDLSIQCFKSIISTSTDITLKKRAVLLCSEVYSGMGEASIDDEIQLLESSLNQFKEIGNGAILEALAEAYSRKAQLNEDHADEYYNKALDLFITIYEDGFASYQLRENIAILYENLNRFHDAEEVLFKMIEEYPENYIAYKRLAFLEADKQQNQEIQNRDYTKMYEYYNQAVAKYPKKKQDIEMGRLEKLISELKDGGWIS